MKRFFTVSAMLLLFMAMIWSGCKTAKVTTPNYIGKWNYVLNTPNGDVAGYFQFSQDGDMVSGVIGNEMGTMELNDLVIDESKVSFNFDFEGNAIDVTGDFEGDILKANLAVQGFEMPFEAKKEQQ